MIRIDEMTRGRFGNRMLYYNNLMQFAHSMNTDASCVEWEGNVCFENLVGYKETNDKVKSLNWNEINNLNIDSLGRDSDYSIEPYCLHNNFYKLCKTNPRSFLKLNNSYSLSLSDNETSVGIHIRGTDILGADGNQGREIHTSDYYKKAIDEVEKNFDNIKYYVCTDDVYFISFVDTILYLNSIGAEYNVGSSNHFSDFSILSECDVLIASSSTFVVAAGFVGKENKKIIHSMEWIQKNLDHTLWHGYEDPKFIRDWQLSYDNFWVELYEGGNEFYSAWRFV
tara:strand:- start:56 stop:901 length:846 start_codon:yes stop_codon:yes gene_type:complete